MARVTTKASWAAKEVERLKRANQKMAETVVERSRVIAPILTGALRADGRIVSIPNGLRVRFGGEKVPYARRRHFENLKNPHTLHYLERGGDSVAKEPITRYY